MVTWVRHLLTRNGASVDILCPSLMVIVPVLVVEPSARDRIPVHKELIPRSVLLVQHLQRSSGLVSERTLQRGPHVDINQACRVTRLKNQRQKNRH